jgi:hypothetical protein
MKPLVAAVVPKSEAQQWVVIVLIQAAQLNA